MCITFVCIYGGAYLKIESMSHCYAYVQIESVLLGFSKTGALYYVLSSNVSLFHILANSL